MTDRYLIIVRETNHQTIHQIATVARAFGADVLTVGGAEVAGLAHIPGVLHVKDKIGPGVAYVSLDIGKGAVPLRDFLHPAGPTAYVLGPNTGTLTDVERAWFDGPTVYVETGDSFWPALTTPVVSGIVLHDRLVRRVT